MTEKELKKLNRYQLLELLIMQTTRADQLQKQLEEVQNKLNSREMDLASVGSIAEASLQLSGIFNAAQDSCQCYMDNIRLLSERQSAICQQMEEETKERCNKMVSEAEMKSQQCWENCSAKIRQLAESYDGLKQAIGSLFPVTQEQPKIEGQHF